MRNEENDQWLLDVKSYILQFISFNLPSLPLYARADASMTMWNILCFNLSKTVKKIVKKLKHSWLKKLLILNFSVNLSKNWPLFLFIFFLIIFVFQVVNHCHLSWIVRLICLVFFKSRWSSLKTMRIHLTLRRRESRGKRSASARMTAIWSLTMPSRWSLVRFFYW